MSYIASTVEELDTVYNLLREKFPERQIRVVRDNRVYKLRVTNDPFTFDPEVPVNVDIQVVYGDTDSIMVKFSYNRKDYKRNRIDTFRLATLCGDTLTKDIFARPPIEMEFEKVFQPFILLTKKRYIANTYCNPRDPFELKGLDAKGIALTRRDYAPIVKKCYREIIQAIMTDSSEAIRNAISVYESYVQRIHTYNVDLSDLVVSAQIGKDYACNKCKRKTEWIIRCSKCKEYNYQLEKTCPKCRTEFSCLHSFSLAHINLAQRMLQRKDSVSVGDRIQYIFVESEHNGAQKNELAEDPGYAMDTQKHFNRLCYLEQVAKPILGFFKIVLRESETDIDFLIKITNDKIVEYGGKRLRPSDFKDEI
ncbi:hypothetical protein EB118_07200 [bacterium]|nr:hypothetical protein [bacterium]NDC94439.1 hypothetical protein [bacterium]NDD84012.1 hypothetical protein [bacterium]NDG29868.1 hypothetical protein [bacterium]